MNQNGFRRAKLAFQHVAQAIIGNQESPFLYLEVDDMNNNVDVLLSLDVDELEALADSKLAPSSQARLDELLAQNSDRTLGGESAKELDELLAKVDQLNILKTRARYTLRRQAESAGR